MPWDELRVVAGGRACEQCATVVWDFTEMTELRARALGLLAGGDRLCARLRIEPTGASVFIPAERLRPSKRSIAVAVALAAAGCSEPPHAATPQEPSEIASAAPLTKVEPPTGSQKPLPVAGPDRDGDSVSDSDDRCPDDPGVVALEGCRPVVVEAQGMVILEVVLFDAQRAIIKKESKAILDEVAAVLLQHPEIRLLAIEGNADALEPLPDVIAKRRAEAVLDYLLAKGVPPDRLVAKSAGNKAPIAANDTAEGRARNRSIRFEVLP